MGRVLQASQLALLLAAGCASFYLAARWRETPGGTAGDAVGVVEAAAPAPHPATNAAPTAPDLERDASLDLPPRDRVVPESSGDAFVARSWLPPVVLAPPPPPPPAPKPLAPVAPPLPFAFVGMLEAGTAKPQAFLSKGDALLVVAAGDMLDNDTYRVDSLSAQQIVMTYLPMNLKQTLSAMGATQ